MKKVLLMFSSFFFLLFSYAQPYLFGTTQKGGFMGAGVVYSYNVATKTYSKVVEFYSGNGAWPVGKLVLCPDQKIYGATTGGGPSCTFCAGVIYSIDPLTNRFTIVYPVGGREISTGVFGKPIPGQLIVASPTQFYASNDTAIYKFDTTTRTFDKLYSFKPGEGTGERFLGSLTVANNGNLYGIRAYGLYNYAGELISFNPNTNTYKVEYKFDLGPVAGTNGGEFPNGDLVLVPNGLLYGSTSDGGTGFGHGVIFTFDPATSVYSVRYTFPVLGPNGDRPYGPLQKGLDGKMYGFTLLGGAYGWGTAFSYSPASNAVTKLTDLDDEYNARTNYRNMLIASDGKFYTTTPDEGATNQGTLFTYLPATKTFQTLVDFDSDKGVNPVENSLIEAPVQYSISCPGFQDIVAGPNCSTVVTGIDPVVFPATAQVNYTLLNYSSGGDTIGKGTGSVSGRSFEIGFQTEVVYSIVNQPGTSCSFIVSVVDRTPPALTVADSVFHCFDDMTSPGSGKYTVPPAHAVDNCRPTVAYRYDVKNSRGVVLRTGYTNNASGRFEEGKNTVEWAVSELYGTLGYTAYDTTVVLINPKLSANLNVVRPITKGVAANTLYLGYSPASTARMEVTPRSGTPGYTYKWTTVGNAVSFTVDAKNSTFIYLAAKQVGSSTFTAEVTDSKGCKFQISKTFTVQDVRCSAGDRVIVCRPGSHHTQCVTQSAVARILNAGGVLGACPVNVTTMTNKIEIASEAKQEGISIIASPNPSAQGFMLTIASSSEGVMRLRIIDEMGRVIEQREGIVPGSTIRIGTNYYQGLYICEVEQNGNRKQIRLIKQGH